MGMLDGGVRSKSMFSISMPYLRAARCHHFGLSRPLATPLAAIWRASAGTGGYLVGNGRQTQSRDHNPSTRTCWLPMVATATLTKATLATSTVVIANFDAPLAVAAPTFPPPSPTFLVSLFQLVLVRSPSPVDVQTARRSLKATRFISRTPLVGKR